MELTDIEKGPRWNCSIPIGQGRTSHLHLLYWTRDGAGLHFDVINQHDGIAVEYSGTRGACRAHKHRETNIPLETQIFKLSDDDNQENEARATKWAKTSTSLTGGGGQDWRGNRIPFTGDYRGASWNAQALFTNDDEDTQAARWSYVDKLMLKHDFLTLSETHATEGSIKGKDMHNNYRTFWSNYRDKTTAGVGVAVSKDFLKNFGPIDEKSDWVTIVEGRAAKLRLRGMHGALDIITIYATSGNTQEKTEERLDLIWKVNCYIDDKNEVLTIISGDFNFVEKPDDRWNGNNPDQRRTEDKEETLAVRKGWKFKHDMVERAQEEYTYRHAGAMSRLDRVYTNHHTTDQLNHHFGCQALDWVDKKRNDNEQPRSFHRALSYEKSSQKCEEKFQTTKIQPTTLKSKKWKDYTDLKFQEKRDNCRGKGQSNPFTHLRLYKEAMTEAASMIQEQDKHEQVEDTADKLTMTMRAIKAMEEESRNTLRKIANRFTDIRQWTSYDNAIEKQLNLRRLKDLAINLAQEHLREEVQQLRKDMDEEDDDNEEGDTEEKSWVSQRKTQLTTKLKRLIPGNSAASIAAIVEVNQEGTEETITKAEEIAKALGAHWENVFKKPCTSKDLLTKWLDGLPHLKNDVEPRDEEEELELKKPKCAPKATEQRHLPRNKESWTLEAKDIMKAIRIAGGGAPGPDSIPYAAWKAASKSKVEVLLDVARSMEEGSAREDLANSGTFGEEGHDFNLGLLVCLGKKSCKEIDGKGFAFKAADTRPLSIVNTDNRILANAYRMKWEKFVRNWVSRHQQGFVRGRSILKDVLDIESAALRVGAEGKKGAILLLDFASAFPSISQEFMRDWMDRIGSHEAAVKVLKAFYDGNRCDISFKGGRYKGFPMKAGVRQGCPLSPLIFAICADLLLAKITKELPTATTRAYADDTAIVIRNIQEDLPVLETIFKEYEELTGLKLNLKKTALVPSQCGR